MIGTKPCVGSTPRSFRRSEAASGIWPSSMNLDGRVSRFLFSYNRLNAHGRKCNKRQISADDHSKPAIRVKSQGQLHIFPMAVCHFTGLAGRSFVSYYSPI